MTNLSFIDYLNIGVIISLLTFIYKKISVLEQKVACMDGKIIVIMKILEGDEKK